MALSKSVIKAQDLISCNLCETETKIKWKCLPCDLLMCDRCRDRIHPKIQNARNHKIIDIKEVGLFTEQDKDIDFTFIKCKQHLDQACCIFCSTCDRPVCPICIAKTHSKHEFLEIKEVYQMKIERLKKGQKRIENDQAKVKEVSKDLTGSKAKKEIQILQDIQDQREALVEKVDQFTYKLTKEVEQNVNLISTKKAKADNIIQTLEEKNKKVEDIIHSKDASMFFDEVDNLLKSMEEAVPMINLSDNFMIKFVAGDINMSNFGSLQIGTSPSISELKVVKEFVTEVNTVHCIILQEDSLWFTNSASHISCRVKLEKDTLKTISTFNVKVFDMSVTPSDDILLSTNKSTLKFININTGKLTDSNYSVKPLITMAVHVTNDYKICTGAMTPGPVFPSTGRRVVMVMDKNGEHQMTYEFDESKKHLFTWPMCITSTRNGNISVVDGVSETGVGRLVILSDKGGVRNIYTGHPEINTKDKPFQPRDIVTTPADNILVSDVDNCLLHILDCDGQFITYIDTIEKGIQCPFSLAYSTIEHLYIGCFTPKSSSEKAKLYQVVLPGC